MLSLKLNHACCSRVVLGILLFMTGSTEKARSEDVPDVRFNSMELENVYRFCNTMHRPGEGMLPCLFAQTQKLAVEKDIEKSAKHAETLTRKQLSQPDADDPN